MTGPPCGDLLLEDRDHAAGRAQHVAEADGDEARLRCGRASAWHVDLGDPLGGPHDGGGVDRLVGGDHHELVDAVSVGEVRDGLGCRRRCSSPPRPGSTPSSARACGRRRGRRPRADRRRRPPPCGRGRVTSAMQGTIIELRVGVAAAPGGSGRGRSRPARPGSAVRGPKRHDLPAELAADAAAGAGDQHHPALRRTSAMASSSRCDRLAAQQVLDGDVADAGEIHPAADDLVEPGDDLDVELRAAAQLGDPADGGTRRVGDGDECLLDPVALPNRPATAVTPRTRRPWMRSPP